MIQFVFYDLIDIVRCQCIAAMHIAMLCTLCRSIVLTADMI